MTLELLHVSFFSFDPLKLKIFEKSENNCCLKKLFQGSIFKQEQNNQHLNYQQKKPLLTCERNLICENIFINPFQPSVAFHIETSRLFCSAKQMTGSYMKCNTGLKWVKGLGI